MRQIFLGNALAGILHHDNRLLAAPCQCDPDRAVSGGVLQTVVEQDDKQLLQLVPAPRRPLLISLGSSRCALHTIWELTWKREMYSSLYISVTSFSGWLAQKACAASMSSASNMMTEGFGDDPESEMPRHRDNRHDDGLHGRRADLANLIPRVHDARADLGDAGCLLDGNSTAQWRAAVPIAVNTGPSGSVARRRPAVRRRLAIRRPDGTG